MTPTPQSASGATARAAAVEQAKPQGADAGPFVLNLCSSTTPMALAKSEQPELKRFSFFVSRRFEEGRERFRLHMGYFATLAEAEEWLGAVRDIYPGAWAGEAPGKKLRERAVAAAAAQAQHAAGPLPVKVPTAPAVRSTLPVARSPVPAVQPAATFAQPAPASIQPPAMNVPTIHAAAPAVRTAPVATRAPVAVPATAPGAIGMMRSPAAKAAFVPRAAPVVPVTSVRLGQAAPVSLAPAARSTLSAPAVKSGAALSARLAAAAPATRIPPTSAAASRIAAAAAGARNAQPVKGAPASNGHPPKASVPAPTARGQGAVAPPARQNIKPNAKPALPNSNVREVLKALDETTNESTGETRMMPAPVLANLNDVDDVNFSDTQVLSYLETRRADGTEITGIDAETGAISLLKPDDTGTRRALKAAITENAPVWFAVQLQWSVQPVELAKVPPLAIFSAYTLYTVEGSRDGRKWFGLRLGFFSDAISAKQVAYYVRSEFTSVAVVPVSPQERTRASEVDKKTTAEMSFPKRARPGPVEEFKLIDSDETPPVARPRPPAAKPGLAARTAPQAPAVAKRNPKGGGTVRARERRGPQTLEETLEILGAGELEMDNGNGETINESGVRHLRVEVQKNTPFSRLLERLSERVRKP